MILLLLQTIISFIKFGASFDCSFKPRKSVSELLIPRPNDGRERKERLGLNEKEKEEKKSEAKYWRIYKYIWWLSTLSISTSVTAELYVYQHANRYTFSLAFA